MLKQVPNIDEIRPLWRALQRRDSEALERHVPGAVRRMLPCLRQTLAALLKQEDTCGCMVVFNTLQPLIESLNKTNIFAMSIATFIADQYKHDPTIRSYSIDSVVLGQGFRSSDGRINISGKQGGSHAAHAAGTPVETVIKVGFSFHRDC